MSREYDAIVIGARCGGSPTAMLLAQRGYRVLMVDKATFPSDTMSTHLVHPPGVAALARWGILERLQATNLPSITKYSFDFGPLSISGTPRPADGAAQAYCPRRIVLDALLVEAAVAAGAELREAFTVEEVLIEDGRVTGVRGHAKITAFGISDAFRDAEAVAAALDDAFAGRRSYDDAMAGYQRARDEESMPIYGLTCDFAKIEPPPPEMQQLMGAMQGNQDAMDGFVSVMAGTLPAPEFFGRENAGAHHGRGGVSRVALRG